MSPQTNLGSAHPVSLGGEMDEEMAKKVTNDAVAYIRGLADRHGRNVEWAEEAVRESVSLPAEDAKDQNVIEFVAADLDDLLAQIDGFRTRPKGLELSTADASVVRVEMAWHERLLHALVNPNVAFLLMLIGIYGLLFELQSPGLGLAGGAGAISLLLALYAFQALPVSYVGLALILVAVVLYVAEVKVQSHGALAAGGTAALILGGLLLFDSEASFLRVDWTIIVLAALLSVAFFVFVIGAVARSYRRVPVTGAEGLVGERGVSRTPLDPGGQILVHGELWKARSEDAPLAAGEEVQVTAVEGMVLKVRRWQD
jgi:membrane-bound serine protease (ClpP class)